MTNAPADLLGQRSTMAGITGLTNPADLGIVGDGRHKKTGGYHEGEDVLIANGMYHPPAGSHVGSLNEDYSVRIARDRNGLTLDASAMDYADNWPNGGRAAWLRWNNALAAALKANVPALAAVRAINYTPDGTTKKRIDRQNGWKDQATSDSVTIHTHVEFYRDTEGKRQAALDYIAQLARLAIANQPAPGSVPTPSGGNDMGKAFLATAGGNYYVCDLMTSIQVSPADAATKAYLAFSNYSQTSGLGSGDLGAGRTPQPATPEWADFAGYRSAVRLGWTPAFGVLVNPGHVTVDLSDEDIEQLAQKIHVDSGASLEEIKALITGAHIVTG